MNIKNQEPEKAETKQLISFRIKPSTIKGLKKLAKQHGVTVSFFVDHVLTKITDRGKT